jgi:hypothetical protein
MVRIKITEAQYENLNNTLLESKSQTFIIKQLKEFLDKSYEPTMSLVRHGGEYFESPMLKVKIDGEMITPKALYEYLVYKFKLNKDFIKQVIIDWINGDIKNDMLTNLRLIM